jgi:hypothetical protein
VRPVIARRRATQGRPRDREWLPERCGRVVVDAARRPAALRDVGAPYVGWRDVTTALVATGFVPVRTRRVATRVEASSSRKRQLTTVTDPVERPLFREATRGPVQRRG